MSSIHFSIIAAVQENTLGIGLNNQLPWANIYEDMKRFKTITTQCEDKAKINVVIMGRRTWDSIPSKFRPLPQRHNIVLTRNAKEKNLDDEQKNVQFLGSFDEAFKTISENSDKWASVYVIGGSEIYKEAIQFPNCDELLLTVVFGSTAKCDTFFPFFPETDCCKWNCVDTSDFICVPNTSMNIRFQRYCRNLDKNL